MWHYLSIWFNFWQALLSDTCSLWDQSILMHGSLYTFPWIWLPIWHLQSVRSVDFDAWQLLHLPLNLAPHLTPAVCEISWFWCMRASTSFSEFGSIWHLQCVRSVDFDAWQPLNLSLNSVRSVDFDTWQLLHLSLNLVPHLTPAVCQTSWFWCMTASTPFSEFGSPSDTCSLWDQFILTLDSFYTFLWIWFPIWHLLSVKGV